MKSMQASSWKIATNITIFSSQFCRGLMGFDLNLFQSSWTEWGKCRLVSFGYLDSKSPRPAYAGLLSGSMPESPQATCRVFSHHNSGRHWISEIFLSTTSNTNVNLERVVSEKLAVFPDCWPTARETSMGWIWTHRPHWLETPVSLCWVRARK